MFNFNSDTNIIQAPISAIHNITLSDGFLSPLYSSQQLIYIVSLPFSTNELSLSFNTIDPKTYCMLNNEQYLLSGNVSTITLEVGLNNITLNCMAETGYNQTIYTILITRSQGKSYYVILNIIL